MHTLDHESQAAKKTRITATRLGGGHLLYMGCNLRGWGDTGGATAVHPDNRRGRRRTMTPADEGGKKQFVPRNILGCDKMPICISSAAANTQQ